MSWSHKVNGNTAIHLHPPLSLRKISSLLPGLSSPFVANALAASPSATNHYFFLAASYCRINMPDSTPRYPQASQTIISRYHFDAFYRQYYGSRTRAVASVLIALLKSSCRRRLNIYINTLALPFFIQTIQGSA